MFERVAGPLKGYFVAAYACPLGEMSTQYIAYYKLFAFEPESYWDSECVYKAVIETPLVDAEAALNTAFKQAAADVANLSYLPTRLRSKRLDDPTLPLAALAHLANLSQSPAHSKS